MTLLLSLVGLVLGAMMGEFVGAFWGAVFGTVLGWSIGLNRRLAALERRCTSLEEQMAGLRTALASRPTLASPSTMEAALAPVTEQTPTQHEELAPVKSAEPLVPPNTADSAAQSWPRRSAVAISNNIDDTPPVIASTLASEARVEEPPNRLVQAIMRFFTGGNALVKIGVVLLFFGVGFAVKYAAEHNFFPITLRLAMIAVGGLVMTVIGWRMRNKRSGYALVMQGGGIGVLYVTIFAAYRLYQLLPGALTFTLLLVMVVSSVLLAILQNSLSLAILGTSGGFLAPILASTGQGSHVGLFSYYAALNAGIFAVAWYKSWRPLNLVGFVFTFMIFSLWRGKYYQPEHFNTTEPFLILFFVMYTVIGVLYALRQPPNLRGYVDRALIFGVPIITFGLQASLVKNIEYGLAYSAVAMGVYYAAIALVLFRRISTDLRLLCEAFLAMAIVLGTVAIPLGLEERWTAAAWALEGAAIVWVGVRQNRYLARVFGAMLQFGAGFAFIIDFPAASGSLAIVNARFLGGALIGVGGLFTAWFLRSQRYSVVRETEDVLGIVHLLWGLCWWYGTGLAEIYHHAALVYQPAWRIGMTALFALVLDEISRRLSWGQLRWPARLMLPLALLVSLRYVELSSGAGLHWSPPSAHPLEYGGYMAWPLMFVVHALILRRQNIVPLPPSLHGLHVLGVWVLAVLLTLESSWWLRHSFALHGVWPVLAYGFVPAVVLAAVYHGVPHIRLLREHGRVYLRDAAGPLALWLVLWMLVTNLTNAGDPTPLTYIPLLNPLDLTMAYLLLVLVRWLRVGKNVIDVSADTFRNVALWTFGTTLFLWANADLARTLHFWADVPLSFNAMLDSALAQSSYSIFWTLLAFAAMVVATRRASRTVWLAGAGLLGVVILKLFVIDLANSGTLYRIISFMGVGVLLLVIGYLTPMPPRHKDAAP